MNTFIVIVLAAIIAMASAGYSGNYYDNDYRYGYRDGFRRVPNGIAAPYNNAQRQLKVNYVAERAGASSGTSRFYGVPGSGNYFGYPSYYRRGGYNYGPYDDGYRGLY